MSYTNVEKILHINSDLPTENWFFNYGITDARYKSLNGKGNNGLFNPNSETAKTLYCFGNLDLWQQIDNLSITPRISQKSNKWNENFFCNIRNNTSSLKHLKSKCDLWHIFIRKHISNLKKEFFEDSILIFEFELMNKAFHSDKSGEAFKKLSFLNIEQREWSNFDATLILPNKKQFIFFECKLNSDINPDTKYFPLINQVYRNLESAYLLTHHDESLYCGWDFTYIFVCPEKRYKYKSTYYAFLLREIKKNGIGLYKELLNTEYKINTETEKYLDNFITEAGVKLAIAHWEELKELIPS